MAHVGLVSIQSGRVADAEVAVRVSLDLIRLWRQWDVVVDLDRLADMDDYKRPNKPGLRLWPFSDGSYGGPSRSVDLSSMSC